MEANAALKAIVWRDTGEDYDAMLKRLAQKSGIETPTKADLIRFDRKGEKPCPTRTGSLQLTLTPASPSSRTAAHTSHTPRTHLAHKPAHVVDLDSRAISAAEIQRMGGRTKLAPPPETPATDRWLRSYLAIRTV